MAATARRAYALTLGVLLIFPAATLGKAHWGVPVRLGPAHVPSDVGMSSDGLGAVAFLSRGFPGVSVARLSATSRVLSIRRIRGSEAYVRYARPMVRVIGDGAGDALVSWNDSDRTDTSEQHPCCDRLVVAFVKRGQANGRAHRVSPAGTNAWSPVTAMGSRGRAIVAWTNSEVRARVADSSGRFGPVRSLAPSPADGYETPVGASVSPTGRPSVMWTTFPGPGIARLLVRGGRPGSDGFSATRTVGTEPSDTSGPAFQHVVGSSAGGALSYSFTRASLRIRWAEPEGRLGNPVTIPVADGAFDRTAAVSASGAAWIVWTESSALRALRIRRGRPDPVRTVPSGLGGNDAALAVDGQGRAVIVWTDGNQRDTRVLAARSTPAGTFTTVRRLSSLSAHRFLAAPRVAMNGGGDALALWHDSDSVWVARFSA